MRAIPRGGFETANEIHIPVGVPVAINLESADVIHAFWVPLLAGKTQMIPGLVNHQWIEADKIGRYRGQCTQFCGVQHAHMALRGRGAIARRFRRLGGGATCASASFTGGRPSGIHRQLRRVPCGARDYG